MPRDKGPEIDPRYVYHDTLTVPPEFRGVTFRDVIKAPNVFTRFFPNLKLPYAYTLQVQGGAYKDFIHPVKISSEDRVSFSPYRTYDVFIIFDKDLQIVPSTGSSGGTFLHEDGYIAHFVYSPGNMPGLDYITALDQLNVVKASLSKTRAGVEVAYEIAEDPALIDRFNNTWCTNGKPERLVNDVINKKLRAYFSH